MKTIRYAALVAIAGLVLTGCGDESTPDAGGGTTAPATTTPNSPTPSSPSSVPSPSTPSTTTPGGNRQGLPLTVTRSGGIAGFSDRVVVGADGVASVSRRGTGTSRCRLDPALLTSLTAASAAVDWDKVGNNKPSTRYPDDMVIAVSSGGGTARLDDPTLRPLVSPVGKLLIVAGAPAGSSRLCKPV